jgi:serine protease Do
MKSTFESVVRRACLLGVVGASCVVAMSAAAKDLPKISVSDQAVDRSAQGVSYAKVIKKVTPSVVTIESTRTLRVPSRQQIFNDPRFRRFFGGDDDSEQESPRKMRQQGLGSGVIVSEDGYILTNNHVVDGADDDGIKIAMADGKTRYDAKLVGKDPRTDIAILKIEAGKKLPALTLADSDKLEVGDVVLAVGNPFGIGQSVSSGIVSALSREFGILGRQGYEDFIQTDASINQGNSGGALVDAEGRLIGINQSIASPSGANAGVGFAVPINLARTVMEQLIADGKVSHGFLGVIPQTVTPGLAESFNLPSVSGVLLGEVRAGTPAAKAGMEAGDVILAINKKPVMDEGHFRLMVGQTPPKTPVTFDALRDGKEKIFTVALAELPDDLAKNSNDDSANPPEEAKPDMLDGVEVADLNNQARRQFNLPPRIRGALVTKVDEDCNAAEAGLRPGDVLVEINRRPVKNAEEAVEVTDAAKGDSILLRVYSQSGGIGSTRYLPVEADKKKK